MKLMQVKILAKIVMHAYFNYIRMNISGETILDIQFHVHTCTKQVRLLGRGKRCNISTIDVLKNETLTVILAWMS